MMNQAFTATSADDRILRLYVAGQTARSMRAVATIQRLCAEQLRGSYRLEVIDLYQQAHLAQEAQIVAVPALVKRLPAPLRMVIGDMSDAGRVLAGLDLVPREDTGTRYEYLRRPEP